MVYHFRPVYWSCNDHSIKRNYEFYYVTYCMAELFPSNTSASLSSNPHPPLNFDFQKNADRSFNDSIVSNIISHKNSFMILAYQNCKTEILVRPKLDQPHSLVVRHADPSLRSAPFFKAPISIHYNKLPE